MKQDRQIVGNIGLYFACFKLSALGLNAMPTSRNAKGVDVVCGDRNWKKTLTFQIKSLSKKDPVGLGKDVDGLLGDYWIIVTEAVSDAPKCYILKPEDVRKGAVRREKDGKVSFWLQPSKYAVEEFEENWQLIKQEL